MHALYPARIVAFCIETVESILALSKDVSSSFDFTVMYSRSKKSIYFNTNYRSEWKHTSIIVDYCLLQFGALKSYLGVLLHGEISR